MRCALALTFPIEETLDPTYSSILFYHGEALRDVVDGRMHTPSFRWRTTDL